MQKWKKGPLAAHEGWARPLRAIGDNSDLKRETFRLRPGAQFVCQKIDICPRKSEIPLCDESQRVAVDMIGYFLMQSSREDQERRNVVRHGYVVRICTEKEIVILVLVVCLTGRIHTFGLLLLP